MVHMILRFAFDLLERIIACHPHTVRANDWVKHRFIISRRDVFGEQPAINLDTIVVAVFLDDEWPFIGGIARLAKHQNPYHH